MYNIDDLINKIICGDSLEELKRIPDESVDMVITSPPYYGLRNYGVEGQIGLEKTFDEYLDKMIEIMREIKRVVKKSGTIWINFGDCYGGQPAGNKSKGRARGQNKSQKCLLMMPERFAIRCVDELGLILRNKIVWAKQVLVKKENRTIGSVMPTSVKDRFNESYELLYFFVKNKKYYSNLDAVRIPNQVLGVTDFRASGLVRSAELYPNSKYAKAEGQGKIDGAKRYNEIPEDYRKKKLQNLPDKGKELNRCMSGTPNYTYQGKFAGMGKEAEMFNSPRARMQRNKVNDPRGNHLGGPGSWRDFKDKHDSFTSPLGKNIPTVHLVGENIQEKLSQQLHEWYLEATKKLSPESFNKNAQKKYEELTEEQKYIDRFISGKILNCLGGDNVFPAVWQINSEPHNFQKELGVKTDHFAVFPQALLEIPIKFGCPPGGIVLDPFMGSGQTALMAKKLGRNFIGIELNQDYIKICEERLSRLNLEK